VKTIAQGEHSGDTLSRMTRMSVALVSAHLQTLKRDGVAARRPDERTISSPRTRPGVAELFVALKRTGVDRSPAHRRPLEAFSAALMDEGLIEWRAEGTMHLDAIA
jgi:hypothetical protein